MNSRLATILTAATLTLAGGIGLSFETAAAGPKKNRGKPAEPVQQPEQAAQWVKGTLRGITTDAQGRIVSLTVQESRGMNTYDGCKAKLSEHPHLVAGLERGRRLDLKVEKDCVTQFTVSY